MIRSQPFVSSKSAEHNTCQTNHTRKIKQRSWDGSRHAFIPDGVRKRHLQSPLSFVLGYIHVSLAPLVKKIDLFKSWNLTSQGSHSGSGRDRHQTRCSSGSTPVSKATLWIWTPDPPVDLFILSLKSDRHQFSNSLLQDSGVKSLHALFVTKSKFENLLPDPDPTRTSNLHVHESGSNTDTPLSTGCTTNVR